MSEHHGLKWWIIDDDPIARTLIRKGLERAMICDVIREFASAEEALVAIENGELLDSVLILLDINMPNLNGWEFIDRLREQRQSAFQKVRIFILSSSIAREDLKKAQTIPEIEAFLHKPLDVQKLNLAIEPGT